jgi:His/Glu/Gln/Arg/opine family amino acid ABC transporter permease subunit
MRSPAPHMAAHGAVVFRHVPCIGNRHWSHSATKFPPVVGVEPRMSINISVVTFGLPLLLRGLVNTVLFSFAAIALALLVGPCVALARLSKRSLLRHLAAVFVEILRNTPFLIQAFLFFYGLAAIGLRVNAILAGILTLSVFGTATFSESFRGAIQSVPSGQMEAATALGMSYRQALRLVIFPQMWGYLIPSLTNQATGLIKECSVLSVITVPEVAMAAQFVIGETFSPTETYVMIALLYWALTGAVTCLLSVFGAGMSAHPMSCLFARENGFGQDPTRTAAWGQLRAYAAS